MDPSSLIPGFGTVQETFRETAPQVVQKSGGLTAFLNDNMKTFAVVILGVAFFMLIKGRKK